METEPRGGLTARDVESLQRPAAYSHAPREVSFLQTHISWLFFAGNRVYKVKKPVDLGFLDATTLAQRLHYCREELRLNRRLAPQVYLGVVGIVRRAGELFIAVEGDPEPAVEYAVEMQRLPADQMLSARLERGEIDNQTMNDLAQLVADFHARAATGPGVDEHGSLATVRGNAEENWAQLEPFTGPLEEASGTGRPALLTTAQHTFLRERCAHFLAENAELLSARVRAGRIRDGHGDLHAGNLCFAPGGIVAYDCIEFSERFRCGDVAADLAFLTMDIDQRGFPAFARYLARRYAEVAGDRELARLEPYYRGYRAVVRGKVTAFALVGEEDPVQRARLAREAMRYLQLAVAYELPAALVLMCGLPASGKSWLGKRLARPLRGVFLQSDVRRKVLAGLVPTRRVDAGYEAGLYTPESKRKTYRSLLGDAVSMLQAGHAVVVDATFSRREYRAPFIDAAVRLGLPYYVVHVTATEEQIRQRMAERAADPARVSDADSAVYERAREAFERPDEVPAGHVLEIASGMEAPELGSAQVLDRMIALATGGQS
jgi:aminoglycoside phosphotransferase family enzyme/predicted kinase